ncbi:MAG TPA: MBL fold metallo-hydrolase, partial [Pyrinomonadaceae bacterium]
YQVVGYAAEDATQISLFFDARTKLLARYELLGSHPLLGDTLTAGSYHEYRSAGGVKVPGRRVVMSGGNVITEAVYDSVTFEFDAGGGVLEVPAGYAEVGPPPAASEPVRRLGDGVYLIEGGLPTNYRMMFVEFSDHLMVLEAPQNASVAQAAIALIRKTVPGKPIRYVGFSHFHFDHTGGLRQFIAEGATVVVPPGNRAFVEALAKSGFTLRPDALALKAVAPKVETFEGKRVFTDGARTLELYSIGPTSHVDDMVIFYFPKEKVLFQGDMFSQVESGGIASVIEVNRELVTKVRELGLEVETLVGVHGGGLRWKTLLEAVEAQRP